MLFERSEWICSCDRVKREVRIPDSGMENSNGDAFRHSGRRRWDNAESKHCLAPHTSDSNWWWLGFRFDVNGKIHALITLSAIHYTLWLAPDEKQETKLLVGGRAAINMHIFVNSTAGTLHEQCEFRHRIAALYTGEASQKYRSRKPQQQKPLLSTADPKCDGGKTMLTFIGGDDGNFQFYHRTVQFSCTQNRWKRLMCHFCAPLFPSVRVKREIENRLLNKIELKMI